MVMPRHGSQGPLHLLIDIEPVNATGSSEPARGTRVDGEGAWNTRKHGGSKCRVWRKLHIGMDKQTLDVRAVGFTTSDGGGAVTLPDLRDQIPPVQVIASVTADGAFDIRKSHDAIAARGTAASDTPSNRWRACPHSRCARTPGHGS